MNPNEQRPDQQQNQSGGQGGQPGGGGQQKPGQGGQQDVCPASQRDRVLLERAADPLYGAGLTPNCSARFDLDCGPAAGYRPHRTIYLTSIDANGVQAVRVGSLRASVGDGYQVLHRPWGCSLG
jgi:hypothetical protein